MDKEARATALAGKRLYEGPDDLRGRDCMRGQTTCRVRAQELLSACEIKEIWVKPYVHRSHEMS